MICLVKSMCAEDPLIHLQETANVLRQYNTKLNTEKCAIKVSSGKLLDFMATNRSIKTIPEHIEVSKIL